MDASIDQYKNVAWETDYIHWTVIFGVLESASCKDAVPSGNRNIIILLTLDKRSAFATSMPISVPVLPHPALGERGEKKGEGGGEGRGGKKEERREERERERRKRGEGGERFLNIEHTHKHTKHSQVSATPLATPTDLQWTTTGTSLVFL